MRHRFLLNILYFLLSMEKTVKLLNAIIIRWIFLKYHFTDQTADAMTMPSRHQTWGSSPLLKSWNVTLNAVKCHRVNEAYRQFVRLLKFRGRAHVWCPSARQPRDPRSRNKSPQRKFSQRFRYWVIQWDNFFTFANYSSISQNFQRITCRRRANNTGTYCLSLVKNWLRPAFENNRISLASVDRTTRHTGTGREANLLVLQI